MIPQDHLLMIRSHMPFRARVVMRESDSEKTLAISESLPGKDGMYFTIFTLQPARRNHIHAILKISVFKDTACDHVEGPLLFLTNHTSGFVQKNFSRQDILNRSLRFLGTNGRGAMMRANAHWGKIESKYDGLLGANLNPNCPDDRRMMLIRCRTWIVFQGYSQEISIDCLKRFSFDYDSECCWEFAVPTGQGQHLNLLIRARMLKNRNQVMMSFQRIEGTGTQGVLPDNLPVRLIIRPDVDDRNFHHTTKAYTGPEHQWPSKTSAASNGFTFTPEPNRTLHMIARNGKFVWEPEWEYMVFLAADAERGMDAHTDLFSPGYFNTFLLGNECLDLSAAVSSPGYDTAPVSDFKQMQTTKSILSLPDREETVNAMKRALRHFLVSRNSHQTVIAGYPWFLDWGRDTLIVTRGMIAAGFVDETRSILKEFAAFEKRGTLPNIIFASDTGKPRHI